MDSPSRGLGLSLQETHLISLSPLPLLQQPPFAAFLSPPPRLSPSRLSSLHPLYPPPFIKVAEKEDAVAKGEAMRVWAAARDNVMEQEEK